MNEHPPTSDAASHLSMRRELIKRVVGLAATLPFAGCAMTDGLGPVTELGSGDDGIMNYALVLESLESEFYSVALARPYAGMSGADRRALENLRDVEIVHREFLRRFLGVRAIPKPEFDFGRVNFQSRDSVLQTAHTFESTGVAAYNGAGHAIRDPRILSVSGKIVSVEARHVALLADMLWPDSAQFAPTPLDAADNARVTLKRISPYVTTRLDGSRLGIV